MDKPSQMIAKAETYYLYFRRDANIEARRLLQRAIDADSKLAHPYAELAYAELTAWLYNWDPSIQNLDNALNYAKQADANEPNDYYNLWVLADVHLYRREFGPAEGLYEKVRGLAKDQAIPEEQNAVHVDWADMLLLTGKTKQAISVVTAAIEQSPVPERWFYWVLGWAYYADKEYRLSLQAMRKLGRPRNSMRKNVIANLVALDRIDDAKTQAKRFLEEEKDQGITFADPGQPVWKRLEEVENRVPFADDGQLSLWKQHLGTAFKDLVAP